MHGYKDSLLVRDYVPARLAETKEGYIIEFYVRNPQSGVFKRIRYKLNREAKRFHYKRDFKIYANNLVCQMNAKLAGGWSPLTEVDDLRLYVKMTDIIDEYLKEKGRELREDTMRSYRSFCNKLVNYINENYPNMYMSLFNKVHAVKYMDYCFSNGKLSARSYNNVVKSMRALFGWAKEKCYVKDNVFEFIKLKRVAPKKRILVDEKSRMRIKQYLEEQGNYGFLLVCNLVYFSLIRPKEIRNIRIRDIMLDRKCIYVSEEVAKTHNSRIATINDDIVDLIKKLNIDKYSSDSFLIGGMMLPSAKAATHSIYGKHWERVRAALKLPKEMQLYSLRDTGINTMLKSGIDPLTVMQHADHHDLAMTTRYANHIDENLVTVISEKAPKF